MGNTVVTRAFEAFGRSIVGFANSVGSFFKGDFAAVKSYYDNYTDYYSDVNAAPLTNDLSGPEEWKKVLGIAFRIDQQQVEPEYPADIIRPYKDGVRRDAMITSRGVYYVPYKNPEDKEIYFKEYPIPPRNSALESIDNVKGSGPTTFSELAEFFIARENDPKAPPPFLVKKVRDFFGDGIGYWQGDDGGTKGDTDWGTAIVMDVPTGYLILGDTYHFMDSGRNQLLLYAHHSICYTGGRAWFRDQLTGWYNLPFWDIEYHRLSHEIRALYVNPFTYHRGKPYPVMVLRAFFEYSAQKNLWFTDNHFGNFYLTVAIKGFSEVIDVHNNVRLERWNTFPYIENDINRKYLQLDYKDAFRNVLTVVANPMLYIDQTVFMGFSRNGVLQHRFMRPFVKKICHPAKFMENEIKNTIPEGFPHLCACVGRDGSADEINNNNKSYRPMNSPPLKQHCVDKHCNTEKTGVYRWYDRTCEPEVFCTESLGIRAIVDLSLRNIVFDENNSKCKLGTATPTPTGTSTTTPTGTSTTTPTGTSTTSTTTTKSPGSTTPTTTTTTTAPSLTSNVFKLPESFFTIDMNNPVNYYDMSTSDESLYVPFIPSTASGIPIDQLLFLPAIPKDNARTAMFESMADLPSLKGNGPTLWGDIGPTLLRLFASNTPLFLARRLSSTPDEPNLPNYSYSNGTSWVPKNYIPVGDCADLQAERRRNSLVLYAHKDICNTDLDMENSDFVRYPDFEKASRTINDMYTMMGYRYWNVWGKAVIVLRAALQFSENGALYFNYDWRDKGSVIARGTSQRGSAQYPYYANTTAIKEWAGTSSFVPLAFPLHALQHLASLAVSPTQDINDGKFQNFVKGDTATPNYDILTLVMRGDAARGASGLCHPKAFKDDEYQIMPYILGFPDVCACIGTNGAEDNLNKVLENYKGDRTTRIKLKCTNQICQDAGKDVYRFPDECPDVQLCIQDVSVRTKVGDLLAENSKVSISDVKQTCNFGGASSDKPTGANTPPPADSAAPTTTSPHSPVSLNPPPKKDTPPATPTPEPVSTKDEPVPEEINVGAIAGGTVGALLFVALIAFLIYLFVKRRGRRQVTSITSTA